MKKVFLGLAMLVVFPLLTRAEIFTRGSKELAQLKGSTFAVDHAVKLYQFYERKAPESLQEVCNSPYIPIECKNLVVPLSNKPILEAKKGEPGFVEIKKDESRAPVGVIMYSGATTHPFLSSAEHVNPLDYVQLLIGLLR